MIKVVLIGTGNVAKFLFEVISAHPQLSLVQVVGRNNEALKYFKEQTVVSNDFRNLKAADIYILAVKDKAIQTVSHDLMIQDGLLVHTSGSISMEALPKETRRGVFYPLQTFSGVPPKNSERIPFCVEAENEEDYTLLEDLAKCISNSVQRISSEKRRQLHLAAVFANNFTNHMYFLASDICTEHKLPFELLKPLICETYEKILHQTPLDAQTGPARRNDSKTLQEHLLLLKNSRHKNVYKAISESIQETYGKKL